jgi:MYND finger
VQLVCLMATHGMPYTDRTDLLRVRQLVPTFCGFTELPYPFLAEGDDDWVLLLGHATWTSHSCAPNVWASLASPTQTLTLIARRAIHAGDRITLSLVSEAQGVTANRQLWLQQLCGLDCDCERCKGRCWPTMFASPGGPCTACGFGLIEQYRGGWRCGACNTRVQQQQAKKEASFLVDMAATVAQLSGELRALQAAAFATGAACQYGSLRRVLRLVADADASFRPCSHTAHSCMEMLHDLYAQAGRKAHLAADHILPRTRATRGWPADAPRKAVVLHAMSAQRAMDGIGIAECVAAQCTECGGANCSAEHPLIGSGLFAAWQTTTALFCAVAAARNSGYREGPPITLAEIRGVLVADAGMAETAADVLLAHLRRYAPLLSLADGAQSSNMLDMMVMLVPMHGMLAPLWCARCPNIDVFMPAGKHTKWCSKCVCVRYCSRECQIADWRDGHKTICPALAAVRSGDAGGDAVTADEQS